MSLLKVLQMPNLFKSGLISRMKVYKGIAEFQQQSYAVVTSGTFDGVHKGHLKILSRLKDIARENNGQTVVITFWPPPRKILKPQMEETKALTTMEEKMEILEEQGIEHLLIIPFTHEFSQLSSEEFIRQILINTIGTKKLVIGYDHRFGKNREGSFEFLNKNASRYGFSIEEIPRQEIEDMVISSTNIRAALSAGNVDTAKEYLGRPYSIKGKVIHGNKLGRTLGYPTANVYVEDPDKLIPQDGVYAVHVRHEDKIYGGMLNIGNNPTIEGKGRSIEVNLFNFNEEIYGEYLTLEFVSFLRKEEKYSSLDQLTEQLRKDERNAKKALHLS
jgi:riboflavin kinase / FMN adenylyltransferase